jgi:molecular chaperone HtpG
VKESGLEHKFQINLGGIIDLLSNHLYSSPGVYLRELLQNGVDAIRARQHVDADHIGHLRLELGITDDGQPRLVFQDDGIGLTEEETHRFLATIGESSKRGVEAQRADFIGQFGIGLLSCFIVSEEIVMVTRSATSPEYAIEWKGRADGTYTVLQKPGDTAPIGTTVFLRCKPGSEEWFEADRIEELVRKFGGLLPYQIDFVTAEGTTQVNDQDVPWRKTYDSRSQEWSALMDFGRRMFNQDFFDCIPLRSEIGQVTGAAYILSYSPNPTAKRAHRVYLKNMLLSEESDNLLPSWAFFVTCVVNTNTLRPVASRESFYEDETLQQTREALGDALRDYLIRLRKHDPERLQALITLHYRAIKALATHDDEFYEIIIDVLPFETSLGRMSMGDFRNRYSPIRYVTSVDTFRQIAQVAASQGLGIINAGYSFDVDLIEKLPVVMDVEIERIDSVDLAENFEELMPDERSDVFELIAVADIALQPSKCSADVKKFKPVELPALFLVNEETKFMRNLENTREVSSDHWASILGSLAETGGPKNYARLCFNFENPLIRKLSRVEDRKVLRTAIQMLYVQALLMGHHPLSANEMALLNTGLLDLIDLAITGPEEGGWVQ